MSDFRASKRFSPVALTTSAIPKSDVSTFFMDLLKYLTRTQIFVTASGLLLLFFFGSNKGCLGTQRSISVENLADLGAQPSDS